MVHIAIVDVKKENSYCICDWGVCYFYEVPTISWSYIRPTNNTHNLAYFLEMSATRTNNRHIARAVEQGASSPVLSQAGVVKILLAVVICHYPPNIKMD